MLSTSSFLKTFVLLSILLGSAKHSYAQTDQVDDELPAKKNSFKITPQAFIVSTFMLSYERYIASGISLQLTGGLMSAQKNGDESFYNPSTGNNVNYPDKDKASGGMVEGMMKYYFLKGRSHMSGLYAGPYTRYSKNNFSLNTTTYNPNTNNTEPSKVDYTIETLEGGAVFGYQVVISNAFVMDMFVGGGIKTSNSTKPLTYTDDNTFWILESQDYNGVIPKAGFRLGFVF